MVVSDMNTKIIIKKDGSVEILTISILEDLWHDYSYFKVHATESSKKEEELFIMKRNQRAALMFLFAFFEGVVNRWLRYVNSDIFELIERKPINYKCEKLVELLSDNKRSIPKINKAKKLRNDIVHLEEKREKYLYEKLNQNILDSTENSIMNWLNIMEEVVGIPKFENSKKADEALLSGLGEVDKELYSGNI